MISYFSVELFVYFFQANYSLAYRAGVAPTRPKSIKRVSEYASRFSWKDPLNTAPILAAEQVGTKVLSTGSYSPLVIFYTTI